MKPAALSALSAAALLLAASGWSDARRPAPAPQPHRAPTQPPSASWRLCPGTSSTALVRPAATARAESSPDAARSPMAALRLSPPMAGCIVSAEWLAEGDGQGTWLVHVQAPATARPAHYAGQLVITSGRSVTRRPVALEVLPFDLMRPSKQYAVTLVPTRPRECCPPDAAEVAALRRLREIGIGALCLAGPPTDRPALEGKMQAAGLRGPVLASVEAASGPAASGGGGGSEASPAPVPGASGASSAASPAAPGAFHVRWYVLCGTPPTTEAAAQLRAGGALIACRAETAETAAGVDLPIFDAGGESGTRLVRHTDAAASGTPGWWRWDAGTATALENRLRCGALLWKSGLSGALVEMSPAASADPAWPLRWAGVCDGIQDSRYLTTLYSLIRQVKDKDRSSPLPGKAEVSIAAALNGVSERPSAEAAGRVRETAITWILRLGRFVWS